MVASNYELKRHEAETAAYRTFLKVAKRVKVLDYDGKWSIVPNPADPLRKFTLNRDIGWCTLQVQLILKDSYKRGVYNEDRYAFKSYIAFGGLFQDNSSKVDVLLVSSRKLRPRLAKALIEDINTKVIPGFYDVVTREKDNREIAAKDIREFLAELGKVEGLKRVPENGWNSPNAELKGCPFKLHTERSFVKLEGTFTYDQLGRLAKANGWGV